MPTGYRTGFAILPLFTEMRRLKTSNVVAVSLLEALMANRSEDFSQWRTTASSHLANDFIHSIFVANSCPYTYGCNRTRGWKNSRIGYLPDPFPSASCAMRAKWPADGWGLVYKTISLQVDKPIK